MVIIISWELKTKLQSLQLHQTLNSLQIILQMLRSQTKLHIICQILLYSLIFHNKRNLLIANSTSLSSKINLFANTPKILIAEIVSRAQFKKWRKEFKSYRHFFRSIKTKKMPVLTAIFTKMRLQLRFLKEA